jgi:hypothetical protein
MKFSGTKIFITILLLGTVFSFYVNAQSNAGEVQIYIFSETGMPMEGISTQVNGYTYESDESGLLTFTHPPGTFDFVLKYEGAVVSKVTIPVRQGQATEVIVTASKQAAEGAADVETAEAEEIKSSEERKQIDESLPTGTLTGKITHIETGEPIPQATIIFRGIDFETTTDESGEFAANIPEGNYSISVIHSDFSTQTMDEIDVEVEETTTIAMELTPSAIDLGEIPVFAVTEVRVQGGIANLIEETRNSGVVLNLIGMEQISRMGDSDAAAALRRVTGLTVVDGRFIYVRGMGERYSSSYLNGALLPSPEVDKRVVPLDLFPVSVIESMAVQKTYSPDMLGDFGGGAVRIKTMGIPEDRYKRRLRANIKASISYDMGSTFTQQLLEEPGRLDWLGIDDGARAMPEEIDEEGLIVEGISGISEGVTSEQIEQFGESLPNTWSPEQRLVPPDFSVGASIRDKIELSDVNNFAFNFSLLYKNGFDSSLVKKRSFSTSADGYNVTTDYDSTTASHNIDIAGLLDLALDLGGNFGIESTTLLTRITESVAEEYEGYFSDDTVDIKVTDQLWVEKMLFNEKLGGEIGLNILNDAEIEWQYAYSLASRYQPDNRTTRYDSQVDENDYYLSNRPEGARRSYTTVTDHVHDGALLIKMPVFFSKTSADFIELGGNALYRTRGTETRKFRFKYNPIDVPIETLGIQDPEEILIPENIAPDGFVLEEMTVFTDNYTADQMLFAGFLNTDILFFKLLRFNAGVRLEYSRQRVDTLNLFSGEQQPTASLESLDILPAVNFTLPLGKKMQMRLGGSRTVNRPDFRELSEAPKDLVIGQGQLIGNPDLKRAVIYNADLRWEAYLVEEESISIGGFFKYFNNAIELKRLPGAGNPIKPDNIPFAYNFGGELEWQLTFRFLSDMFRNAMRNLNIDSFEREKRVRRFLGGLSGFFRDLHTSGNFSYIYSRIDFGDTDPGINTTLERPLQGQSPFVLNVSLGYKNSVSWSQHQPVKMSLFLNYNVFGKRISKIGTQGLPDYYEQPFHQLDVVLKQRFSEIFSINFKAKNILNLYARETIGPDPNETIVQEYKKGRSFSFGVSFDL